METHQILWKIASFGNIRVTIMFCFWVGFFYGYCIKNNIAVQSGFQHLDVLFEYINLLCYTQRLSLLLHFLLLQFVAKICFVITWYIVLAIVAVDYFRLISRCGCTVIIHVLYYHAQVLLSYLEIHRIL